MKPPNKRDLIMGLLDGRGSLGYVPAAFFLHFDPQYHRGQAAVDRHLEFFRYTGMDFVKIQYEHPVPKQQIRRPEDWTRLPRVDEAFFAEPLQVVQGIVRAARGEAMVVVTLYSPFMWASQMAGDEPLIQHIHESLPMVQRGMETITENVRSFVRACIRLGVDGFYASTQGGESHRISDPKLFEAVVKPYDLSIMEEIDRTCRFNILHICDYSGGYDSLDRFLDYPGHVVNSPLEAGGKRLSPRDAAALFGRPYMGGLDRHGVIASGSPDDIRAATRAVLAEAPERFILAADCTVPSSTPWENLPLAIETAHAGR
jgi:uroporphyrinogen decarboxylase